MYFDYHRQHGTAVEVARTLNAYGPQRHPGDGREVPHFIVQVLRGEGSLSTAMAGRLHALGSPFIEFATTMRAN